MQRVEKNIFDTLYVFENQCFIRVDVEFEFALFFGMLIKASYLWYAKMNVLTLKNKVIMKKILGLIMMFLSLHVFAGTLVDEKKTNPVDVELHKGDVTNDDTYLRTLIPITCVYADGMVQLSLLGEVGEFTLTVTNQMTGEYWSAENVLVLQTSIAVGIYQVQIVTEDGCRYYGTYVL